MPIPFLFIAAGVGTGLLGVGKGIKAGIDQKEANDTVALLFFPLQLIIQILESL